LLPTFTRRECSFFISYECSLHLKGENVFQKTQIQIIIIVFLILCSSLTNKVYSKVVNIKKFELIPTPNVYLTLKDINVREGPKNKSRRVITLKRHVRINVAGRVKGTRWLSIIRGGKKLGFVYATALTPVLEGSLKKPIAGVLKSNIENRIELKKCSYQINFVDKEQIINNIQVISNYQLTINCKVKKKIFFINATMFLTELPYLGNKKPNYQINLDLINIPDHTDMFALTIIYNLHKNKINFDQVNSEYFWLQRKIPDIPVLGVKSALISTVQIAYNGWNERFWRKLEKNFK